VEVIKASDKDFEELLANNEKVIVKYYAGWCGSCRLIAPKFNKLAGLEENEQVTFLSVDAENSPKARSLAKVNNLPFFAGFKNGELVEGFPSSKIEAVEELIKKL
tara:strand:- start:109 stop:423 length:315 start_codon:yes stop_codon:yes gene_type:complete